MLPEVWKDIKGYEGLYKISNLGRIQTLKSKKSKLGEYFTGSSKGSNGYIVTSLRKEGKVRQIALHVLIAEAFIPKPSNKNCIVNHINGIKYDNRIENLEWIERDENAAHGYLLKGKIITKKRRDFRLGTLKYLHRIHKFNSVDDFLDFLESSLSKELKYEFA